MAKYKTLQSWFSSENDENQAGTRKIRYFNDTKSLMSNFSFLIGRYAKFQRRWVEQRETPSVSRMFR